MSKTRMMLVGLAFLPVIVQVGLSFGNAVLGGGGGHGIIAAVLGGGGGHGIIAAVLGGGGGHGIISKLF